VAAEYLRLMSGPLLLAYASKMPVEDLAVAEPGTSRLTVPENVLTRVNATLAGQYSQNRRIYERRGRHRTPAGRVALVSVLIVLVLVAMSMV
jgi:hypothetical protein